MDRASVPPEARFLLTLMFIVIPAWRPISRPQAVGPPFACCSTPSSTIRATLNATIGEDLPTPSVGCAQETAPSEIVAEKRSPYGNPLSNSCNSWREAWNHTLIAHAGTVAHWHSWHSRPAELDPAHSRPSSADDTPENQPTSDEGQRARARDCRTKHRRLVHGLHGEFASIAAAEDFGVVHLVGGAGHHQELARHAGPHEIGVFVGAARQVLGEQRDLFVAHL